MQYGLYDFSWETDCSYHPQSIFLQNLHFSKTYPSKTIGSSLSLPFPTPLLFYFICFCLHWVFIAACGLSLVVERGLFITVASLFVEHGLLSMVSVVVGHGLSCLAVCGIFLDQRSNSCSLHWQVCS